MAVKVVNARDIRNNVGLNGIPTDNNAAAGAGILDFCNVRWIRNDMVHTGSPGNVMSSAKSLQTACVNGGLFDPNPKYQVIVDGYLQDASNFSWEIQKTYLQTALTIKNQNGGRLIQCVEGPNEWGWGIPGDGAEQGGGSVLPNGNSDVNQGYYTTPPDSIMSGIVQWAAAIDTFRDNNSSLFTNPPCEVISPTYLDFSGNFGDYPTKVKLSQYVDYGTFHEYTGVSGAQYGTWAGSPTAQGYQGARMYHGMQGGFDGDSYSLSMVVSEAGPYDTGDGTWSSDGNSSAWTTAHTIFDMFALGGHRVMFYTAWNHAEFQYFSALPSGIGNRGTPKKKAQVLRNIMTLLSLSNNYKNTANLTDTNSFTPTFNASNLSVTLPSGDAPGVGSSVVVPWPLVMPKSDGSTMIAIWREPPLEQSTGSSIVPTATSCTVSFGSSQNWKVWCPCGSTNGQGTTFADSPGQVASGTGTSATFNLYGTPLLVELTVNSVTSAPSTPTGLSSSNVTATRATISWTAASSGQSNSPSGYDIQYQKGSTTGTWLTFASVDTSSNSFTMYGFDTSSQYYVRIIAKNSIGSSTATSPINFTTTAQSATKTPAVIANQYMIFREDNDTGSDSGGITGTGGGSTGGGTTTGLKIQNGQLVDSNNNVWYARGVNITDSNMGSVSTSSAGKPLLTFFPRCNFVRVACYSYLSASSYATFITQMTDLGIVTLLEHHVGAGGGTTQPLTGSALIAENNWFASLATAYKNNPLVWFGTLNEPGDDAGGSGITTNQVSNYNAIRNTGATNIVVFQTFSNYADGTYHLGSGYGLTKSAYANMTSVIWDTHFYNWITNYSTDQTTNNNKVKQVCQQAQTITSADGVMPVIIGEYGISTDDQNLDAGGTQTCIAVQNSGYGCAAWNYNLLGSYDGLVVNGSYTTYGQQVANWMATAA